MADRDSIYKRFGLLLSSERKRAGLTQQTLAKLLNVSRTTIANLERGQQAIQLHNLYDLAAVLKVELETLLPKDIPAPVRPPRLFYSTHNTAEKDEILDWLQRVSRRKGKDAGNKKTRRSDSPQK